MKTKSAFFAFFLSLFSSVAYGSIIISPGAGGSSGLPLAGGGTNYVQINPASVQTGAYWVSSGTVAGTLTATALTVNGPNGATITYGLTAGTITAAGSGAGQLYFTEGSSGTVTPVSGTDILWADSSSHTFVFNPNNTSTYTVVGSSTSPTINNLAVWSSQGSLVDGGVPGGMLTVNSVTGNYTTTSTDTVVSVTTNLSTATITLNAASTKKGQRITVFKIDIASSSVKVNTAGSDTINGSTNSFTLNAQGQTISLVSDGGTKWLILMAQATPASIPDAMPIANASVAAQASSTTFLNAVTVPVPIRATGCFHSGGGAGANIECGIYDSKGTLMATSGSSNTITANSFQNLTFTSAVNLQPGVYYLAIGLSNATNQLKGSIMAGRCSTVAANIPLGASITVPGTFFPAAGACGLTNLILSGGSN